MRKSAKIITALSVAGLAVAAGSAFTGGGLSTSGTAAEDSYVGGSVTQNINGATLTDTSYAYVVGGSNTAVASVTLTFADEPATYGKTVTAALGGGSGTNLTCAGALGAVNHVVTCSSDGVGYASADSLTVTVG
ncbi:hypothetical protein [Arthrobacter sp. Y81]|uniref:hypothetical protein n=1 Tax=Arthrobacter sp. Y81 TaxID=2058897 RepID=UPI000CE359C6|nr:hypothetical protein [Arthrobacter sp. Y81]